MVSVTDVAVTRDLAMQKFHIAFVGERTSEEIKQGLDALNGASGYLQITFLKYRVACHTKVKLFL